MSLIKKIISTSLLLIVFTSVMFSQNDYQLAIEYYKSEDYEKASVIFEKLYESAGAKFYFDYYLKCLIEMEDYETAEKKVKKQIKKNGTDISYYVDLGYIYSAQGNEKEALEKYQYAVDNVGSDKTTIILVANSFLTKKLYEWSEKVYLKARENTGNSYYSELANLYAAQMKREEMIVAYLSYIKETPSQISSVKTIFEYYLNHDINDEFSELLRTNILLKIQEKPNDTLTELLIWFYTQKQDYYSAYIQAKALDIKNSEIGVRVYNIAELSAENSDYSTAYEAYEYVVNKGRNYSYYNKSRFGILTVLYQQVINNEITTNEQITNLETQYQTTIEEIGFNTSSIDIIMDLAHLQAFYLKKPDDAIVLLEEAIEIKGLTSQQKGLCQIELGDILLLTNDVWTATLTYAKAENENIGNDTGDMAKFKKAKVYYYTGNFLWAQSQLDVLKASTSKLIANDAFELAKMIKEAITEDSSGVAIEIYSRADLLFSQNKNDEAILTLDTLISKFSYNTILDDAYFLKYEIYLSLNNYEKAAENLETITASFMWENLADKSLYLLADMYENQFDDKEKAMELYKKLMTNYQGSLYIVQARERFRELRGDFVQ